MQYLVLASQWVQMAAVNRTRLDELSGQARASSEQLKVAVSRTASKHSADFVPEVCAGLMKYDSL
jgi:hypothetical protein